MLTKGMRPVTEPSFKKLFDLMGDANGRVMLKALFTFVGGVLVEPLRRLKLSDDSHNQIKGIFLIPEEYKVIALSYF